jgi:hypothetical protein
MIVSPFDGMDKGQARQFRDRWRAVEEVQHQEAHEASLEQRWCQLNAAYVMGRELGLSTRPSEEREVRQRWVRLKKIAGLLAKV